jgi:allantoicase
MIESRSVQKGHDPVGADHNIASLTTLADLASARVGGRAVATNDEFFAPRSNLLKPGRAIFIPDKFTTRGKWMDGWETRRRRTPGHDWCVVALGMRGVIRGVNVDTSYFTGNFPSHCSIDAIDSGRTLSAAVCAAEGAPWTTLLQRTELRGNAENIFPIESDRSWTHVRLNIFPDGGVARLRVHGDASVDWTTIARRNLTVDLAAITSGGLVLRASDMHFGAKDNMIMPGRAKNMGDGWETGRRRGPGYDWAIVQLGTAGVISKIEIDTNHFKGNYPESASLEGALAPGARADDLASSSWKEILARVKLQPDHRHVFKAFNGVGAVSHVRLNIFPDGGVSRLRVYGKVAGD